MSAKTPRPPFRGNWCPPELWDLLHSGRINHTEFTLILYVDKWVKYKGLGCYTSSKTIGIDLHLSAQRVKDILTRLVKNGYLLRVGTKKVRGRLHRVLETPWSRVVIPCLENKTGAVLGTRRALHTVIKTYTQEPAAEAAAGEVSGMFFEGHNAPYNKDNKAAIGEIHYALASELRSGLKSAGRKPTGAKRNPKWADQFRRLLKRVPSLTPQVCSAVVSWYCANADNGKLPSRVYDAKGFCSEKVFAWIYDAYRKAVKTEVKLPEAWQDSADSLVSHLKGKGWRGAEGQLKQAVSVTLYHFIQFFKRAKEIAEESKAPYGTFVRNLASPAYSPYGKTEEWFARVHEKIRNWEGWSGNLLAQAWNGDKDHPEFRKWIDKIASEYNASKKVNSYLEKFA